MANEALAIGATLWLAAAICAIFLRPAVVARGLLALGCVAAGLGAVCALPAGSATVHLPLGIAGIGMDFLLNPSAA